MNEGKEIRFIDMFAGVGGFHWGLTNASKRFKAVWANEWDKYASSVYRYRFPETPLSTADIRAVQPEALPDFDLLCAGFPCQAFSVAGKRGGFEDTRGTLFFEIARIARVKRPRLLLLENVKGLLNHDAGATFTVILSALDELGYNVEWQVLNSKHFGVPQNRERVFIIGYLGERPAGTVFPITEVGGWVAPPRGGAVCEGERVQTANTLSARYGKDGSENLVEMINAHQWGTGERGDGVKKEESFTLDQGSGRDYLIHNVYGGFNEGVRVFDDISPTIRTPKSGGHLPYVANSVDTGGYLREMGRHEIGKHGLTDYRIRRLTPIECERLQAFPDGWTEYGVNEKGVKVPISDSQRYKMMGNALTTNVVRFIGERLLTTQTF